VRDEAAAFVRQCASGDKPFFLYVPLPSPHTPTAPHPEFQGKTQHKYTDYLFEVDDVVGTLVATLRDQGALDNTLIVFTSDNGASLRWAGAPGHHANGALRGQKADAYEGGH